MTPLLVGTGGLLVASLVVADHLARVSGRCCPPTPTEESGTSHVERPAHLLHRHLGIFPPAGDPCGATRTPAPQDPEQGAAPTPPPAPPRSASAPPRPWRPGSCVRSSPAGTPPPAPGPAARSW